MVDDDKFTCHLGDLELVKEGDGPTVGELWAERGPAVGAPHDDEGADHRRSRRVRAALLRLARRPR